MGQQVIKQPDGKLALFSTTTDQIIGKDLTREEVIDFFVKQAVEIERPRAELSVLRAERTGSSAYLPFALTWDEAVRIHYESAGPDLDDPDEWEG